MVATGEAPWVGSWDAVASGGDRGLATRQAAVAVSRHHEAPLRRLPRCGLRTDAALAPRTPGHADPRAGRGRGEAILPEGGIQLRAGLDPHRSDPRAERGP